MRTWFRSALFAGAAAILTVSQGCTPAPEFTPPIQWKSQGYDLQMSVRLNEGGVGYVENLPIGTAQEGKYVGGCVNDSTERYTGEMAWHSVSQYGVEITFPDSKYILGTGTGMFGDQDWSELRIAFCGDERDFWSLNIVCGKTGIEYYDSSLPACG